MLNCRVWDAIARTDRTLLASERMRLCCQNMVITRLASRVVVPSSRTMVTIIWVLRPDVRINLMKVD